MPPCRATVPVLENIHIPAGQRRNVCGRGCGHGRGQPQGGGHSNTNERDANEEQFALEPITREIVNVDPPPHSPTPEDIKAEK